VGVRVAREAPYITVEAEAPLDPRWTPALWFAWCKILATCRLKRAVTAESWPVAVLTLRTHEACAILETSAPYLARTLDKLALRADITWHKEASYGVESNGLRWIISVANYAKYQKLGRPTSARSCDDVSDPPYVPTSLRKKEEKRERSVGSKQPPLSADLAQPEKQRKANASTPQPRRARTRHAPLSDRQGAARRAATRRTGNRGHTRNVVRVGRADDATQALSRPPSDRAELVASPEARGRREVREWLQVQRIEARARPTPKRAA